MAEAFYQGSTDIVLAKARAKFDSLENQSLTSLNTLKSFKLLDTDAMGDGLFTTKDLGQGVAFRHVDILGMDGMGTRNAGGSYSEGTWRRGYETEVLDPDQQVARKVVIPEERLRKEDYKEYLDRGEKLLHQLDRTHMQDTFELFNLAFTAPTSYPTVGVGGNRFFARGNRGLDGNYTPLGERLISIQHARADGGATWSNAIQSSGNARAFSDDAYWAAREQGAAMVDDLGQESPRFGGRVTLVVPPANGLVRLAKELDETEQITGSAENDINIHKGMMTKIISSPYLLGSAYVSGVTDTSKWFLVDDTNRSTNFGTGFVCLSFQALETKVEREDATDSYVYKIKESKVYGWMEPRQILGSKGNGAAYSS